MKKIIAIKLNKVVIMLVCIITTCLFLSCSDDEGHKENTSEASRTVIIYCCAENSLGGTYNSIDSDVHEMIEGINDKSINTGNKVVLYVDDLKESRIYLLKKNVKATSLDTLVPEYVFPNDENSASSEQVKKVLNYTVTHHPAKEYALVMWSHASGWLPSRKNMNKSFGVDNQQNNSDNVGSEIEIPDLAKALNEFASSNGMFEFILFDACFMQNIEVAYELRNCTKYIIASPAEIPNPGANYATVIPQMFSQTETAKKVTETYYREYSNNNAYGVIISFVDTEKLDDFAELSSEILNRYKAELLNMNYSSVQDYFYYDNWSRISSSLCDFYDAKGIIMQLEKTLDAKGCDYDKDLIQRWKQQLTECVRCNHTSGWYSVYNQKTNPLDEMQCSGLSMYIPLAKYDNHNKPFNSAYVNTEWGRNVWK